MKTHEIESEKTLLELEPERLVRLLIVGVKVLEDEHFYEPVKLPLLCVRSLSVSASSTLVP